MEGDTPSKTSWIARRTAAFSRWMESRRPEPPLQTLDLAPQCSECGTRTTVVVLSEYSDGWRLVFQGVNGPGNGSGDPVSEEKAQAIRNALTPPYKTETIKAAGFYDDFGFCTECEAFYCGTHWNVSTTGGGTCPAGHFKSLDPHWHPDWDEL